MTAHLLGCEHLVDQNQAANDFSYRACTHVTVGDAWVIAALTGMAQVISIVRHNDASFTPDEVEVGWIVACAQTSIHRGGDVNPVPTQRSGDVRIHMLVQVELIRSATV